MNPYWVKTGNNIRIAIVPRPRGGDWLEDEIQHMKLAGVDVLVSMLPDDEAAELGLAQEAALCEAAGITFFSFPIPDRQTPSSATAFGKLVDSLSGEVDAGRSVGVHCRASIGRSSLLLASLLASRGMTPDEAFLRLSEARGIDVPDTPGQVRWVNQFAQSIRTP
jgi:protein-tyrosine phosphatase